MKRILGVILVLLSLGASTQTIKFISEQINVDGFPNEAVWNTPSEITNFTQFFPTDSLPVKYDTEVWMAADNENLYVFAKCYFKPGSTPYIQTLKRDFSGWTNDAFGFFMDPYNDGQNGFYFEVNAKGAQGEGIIKGGGWTDQIWDQKWYSATQINQDHFTAEFAIPFKSIRYSDYLMEWEFNFGRTYTQENETSLWVPCPRNFDYGNLSYLKPIRFEKKPPSTKKNFAIIPSVTSSVNADYENDEQDFRLIPSMDAKITVTPSLNLDLTINPDFSQTEVDVQQTNLSRFELFFPERRQFFIENSDLFGEFGFRQIRPFFSRRIGLNRGALVPIIGGARLSGRLNDHWRIGLMNMQTEGGERLGIEGQNYTVAAFQRKVFHQSNIAGIFVNRQGFNQNEINFSDFNRVGGIDFNLSSKDNKWRGKVFQHFSHSAGENKIALANASWLMYSTPEWFIMWNHEFVDENYSTETGFSPRNKMYDPVSDAIVGITYTRLEPLIRYNFYPQSEIVLRHGPELYLDLYTDKNLDPSDRRIQGSYYVDFKNSSRFNIRHSQIFTKLFFPTDISFNGNPELPAGNYYYNNTGLNYFSDNRRDLSYGLSLFTGKHYTGQRLSLSTNMAYRIKPKTSLSVSYERNWIDLPEFTESINIDLLGVIADISFTDKIFFKTFLQYNAQADNINLNSRFQWRFKPLSDIYIVYSDNYNPQLSIKNRSLAVKFIYWISI